MATTYTADPLSGLAPSAVPDPDTVPVITLPADGDAANAASVAQALKQPSNEIAWLKAPFAKASAWVQRIRRYRNARGQYRAETDHEGFFNGNVVSYDEIWDRTAAGTFGADLPWTSTPGSGSVLPGAPNLSAPGGGKFAYVTMAPAMSVLGVPAASYLRRTNGSLVPHADMVSSLSYPLNLTNVGTNHMLVVHGLIGHTGTPDSVAWGARFRKDSADTNWQCEVDGVGAVDSGVAPVANTYQRFKIVVLGSGTSDDSTARVLFFIDDAASPVANVAHLVTATNSDRMVPFFGTKGDNSGVGTPSANVGPLRYRQNMFQTV